MCRKFIMKRLFSNLPMLLQSSKSVINLSKFKFSSSLLIDKKSNFSKYLSLDDSQSIFLKSKIKDESEKKRFLHLKFLKIKPKNYKIKLQ